MKDFSTCAAFDFMNAKLIKLLSFFNDCGVKIGVVLEDVTLIWENIN